MANKIRGTSMPATIAPVFESSVAEAGAEKYIQDDVIRAMPEDIFYVPKCY